ncbi:MAG: signal peptidase II, partial [Planctomycetota bacterium]
FSPGNAWLYHASLALVLAGALGNLYDRVVYAAVRDMLHMLPGVQLPFGMRWPSRGGVLGSNEVWPWVFNLADVSLLAGVAGVMIETWRGGGVIEAAGATESATREDVPGSSADTS